MWRSRQSDVRAMPPQTFLPPCRVGTPKAHALDFLVGLAESLQGSVFPCRLTSLPPLSSVLHYPLPPYPPPTHTILGARVSA
jgi:hypothetical protein